MARRRPQASTAARGYGGHHRRLREQWAPVVASGRVDCWRCGQRIQAGTPWDLGHDDHDRRRYRGPEHRGCNRDTWSRRAANPEPRRQKWW